MQQNDPDELLEVFDAAGRPTGRARARAAIHIDGDWHRAFHCWVVRGVDEIVMQRRALTKDTFPGLWDASAAGHWRFGETAEQAAREIAEELGLEVPFSALRFCGRERLARRFPERGLMDREHHQVYVLRREGPLVEYRPEPREVIGLAAFHAGDLIDLFRGRRGRVEATESVELGTSGAFEPAQVLAERDEFVPYSAARIQRLLGCAQAVDRINAPWPKVTRTRRRPSARD